MPLENLERLVERKRLSRHEPTRREVENHLASARAFRDAASLRGTPERVRFHNLYDAAHAVALAGLKLAGYRAPDGEGNRQVTLGCVEQTLAVRKGATAAFLEANRLRSLMQYQGEDVDIPDSLVEILRAAIDEALVEVQARIKRL